MWLPVLIVNLKNYKEASGKNCEKFLQFAMKLRSVGNVLIAPPLLDTLKYVAEYRDVLIMQSIDTIDYGSSTGHVPLKRVVDEGIKYSLLNHSECKIPHSLIKGIVSEANELNFTTVVCVESVEEMSKLIELGVKPSAFAIEPPELIGTGKSVSKYRADAVRDAVALGSKHGIPVLCGAGVSEAEDVRIAMKLGVSGVLVSSSIVKAADPLSKMEEFIRVIKSECWQLKR